MEPKTAEGVWNLSAEGGFSSVLPHLAAHLELLDRG